MKKFENMIAGTSIKTIRAILNLLIFFNILIAAEYCYSRSNGRLDAVSYKSLKAKAFVPPTPPPLLRLKLFAGNTETDDIAIGFSSTTSVNYNPNEDSQYLPGIDAPVGLSCFSADNVRLSVDLLPLPLSTTPLIIRLDVEAQNSGTLSLLRTRLDTIPSAYNLWLVDAYKKDSVDLRNTASYSFNINKADSATFGINRFRVVITLTSSIKPVCGDTTAKAKILTFAATKSNDGSNTLISWAASNERNTSHFWVERSNDDGATFETIDSLLSNSAGVYSFADKTPGPGTDVYRLKMTDLHDSVSYSDPVSLSYPAVVASNSAISNNALKIYPNPAVSVINLSIKNDGLAANASAVLYDIMIMNSSGIVVKTATSSQTEWHDNISNLLPGAYFVNIVKDNDKSVVGKSKFIKL